MPRKLKTTKADLKQLKISSQDKLTAFLNIFFSLLQIITAFVFDFLKIGKSISNESNNFDTPVIPAGYAFSIWGLIYLLALLYSLDQLRFKQFKINLYRKIGPYTALSFLLCSIWQLIAKFVSFSSPTLIPMTFLLISSLYTIYMLKKINLEIKNILLPYLTVSILAGWVSVAFFANISSVLIQNSINFNLGSTTLSASILFIATIFAIFTIFKTSNLAYASTIVWALIAILIKNVFINLNELIFYELTLSILAVCFSYYLSKE